MSVLYKELFPINVPKYGKYLFFLSASFTARVCLPGHADLQDRQ